MKWLSNMKISSKIIAGFILVSLIAGGVIGAIGLWSLSSVNANSERVYSDVAKPIKDASMLGYYFQMTRCQGRDILLHAENEVLNSDINSLRSTLATVEEKYTKLNEEIPSSDTVTIKQLNSFKSSFDKYVECTEGIIDLVKQNKQNEAKLRLYTSESYASLASQAIVELNNRLDELALQMDADNRKTASSSILLVGLVTLVAVIVSVGLGILIASAISRPIKNLVKAADKLSAGDTAVQITMTGKDEVGLLAKAFQSMIDSIGRMIADTNMLVQGAQEGKFGLRADETLHQGDYLTIITGVNKTLDVVVDKVMWYESLLDAVPLPLFATDLNMSWTFVNRAAEEFIGVKRSGVLGLPCSSWNANICNTENCSIARMKAGFAQTLFEDREKNLQANVSSILDAKGETVGYVEVVQDVTARARVNSYLVGEVAKFSVALGELAQGSLSCQYAVDEGDEYTGSERESFVVIAENLSSAMSTIRGYISDISDTLHRMASGDVSMPGVQAYRGDFAGISESLNIIAESFNSVLGDINRTAEQVASGTRQVSDGSQALSRGAAEQAGSIEQLTASLADIADQSKQNALMASQASELAASARADVLDGDGRMRELQQAMAEISDASQSISKVIKVIDEIAFQTNLLALNAAVEAARAGQYGKGFAVVADEVRSLAQRSAGAAKETTAMIEGTIRKTKAGTRIANETAESLNRILGSVQKAAELISSIAQASSVQASAVEQVNRGIEKVSQVTQSSTATAEQSAAASEQLSGQAQMLKEMVGRFSLREIAEGKPEKAFVAADRQKIALRDRGFGKY